MTDSERHLAAIMFTDMVGYSALAQADEAAALSVLDRHNRVLRPVFARYRGREVKTIGDAFLVEFDSALEAVECAVNIQRSLHEYNGSAPQDWRIQIRIGIHIGDVVRSGGDVLGDAVNIASRIQPLAPPGGICFTQQVYDQVENKLGLPVAKLPVVPLKNIRAPVTVYRVIPPWETGGAVGPPIVPAPSRQIAVLPLANISADPHDEYFADGLTEELIASLSQVRGLGVIARTSVAPYKTAPKPISQVGAELGVGSILEGSVRKAGNRIRITLQLIDVGTQRHIWASSYNREIDDVFAVQSDIAERTAAALRFELAPDEQPAGKRKATVNPAAYDVYLRGLVAASDFSRVGFQEAVRDFERATTIDPDFAEAYATLSNLYVAAAGESLPMREVMPRARALAARALELDPNSSDAHASLANVAFQFDHDWALAEREFCTAIGLNPSNVIALRFYGLMLSSLGRFPEAIEMFRRGVRLDPAGRIQGSLAWALFQSGDAETAMEIVQAERLADPNSFHIHLELAMLYQTMGRVDDARRELDVPLEGASADELWDHALYSALLGRPEAARRILEGTAPTGKATYESDTHRALLYAAVGEGETALDLLEKEYNEGDRVLWLYYRASFFDRIRDHPRFRALLHSYGLPEDAPGASASFRRTP